MIDMEPYRDKTRELFPKMPLNAQEELLIQIAETLEQYGAIRIMTIGEVVKEVLRVTSKKIPEPLKVVE